MQNKGAHNVSRKDTPGWPKMYVSRFYEKNKFAKIAGGPMCRCLIWRPNLNLLYGMYTKICFYANLTFLFLEN